jgi:hypothetical protein
MSSLAMVSREIGENHVEGFVSDNQPYIFIMHAVIDC